MEQNNAQKLYQIIEVLKKDLPDDDLSFFYLRLGAQFGSLVSLFERLYGEREDFEEQLQALVLALSSLYQERAPELRELDRAREQVKDWYMNPNWVATMLYLDRYCDDLKGFPSKVDYLEELGVNYVHLMPLLKMPKGENDGGYAVSDYRTVDERFGTMEDIQKIARIFRGKNMLLELDLVLNHTADEHEWAAKALAGEQEYQDMYYFYDDRRIPDLYEQTLEEVFPDTAPGNFTYIEKLDKWVMTRFSTFQWDLNYTNPVVFTEMAKILLNLANQGIDVLRLDAVAFMWKQLGTSSMNLEEAHLLLQALKVCARICAPGVLFKAEAIVQPKEIVKYLGGGVADECEIAYNASLMVYLWDTMATESKVILEQGLNNIPRLPKGTTWINYIRCHDDIGLGYADEDILQAGFNPFDHRQYIISYYVGEFAGSPAKGNRFMYNPKTKDARITGSTAALLGLETAIEESDETAIDTAINKILLMHSVIMTIGGIPLVYYGDEIACINDYSYLDDAARKDDNRWLNRPLIDWEKVAARKKKDSIEERVFSGLKKMIALRKTFSEFNSENDFEMVSNPSPGIFTFVRRHGWHQTLVAVNLTGSLQQLSVDIPAHAGFGHFLKDAWQDQEVTSVDGQILLEPYQFLWLQQR